MEFRGLKLAIDSAMKMQEESGLSSGWYDFAQEDEYNERIEKLECGEDKFEEDLTKAAMVVAEDFDELLELDTDDFMTEEEFWEERHNIQDRIFDKIHRILKKYCYE